MSLDKINTMWKILAKNIYLVKILFLTVIRHYFPGHRRAINFYKKITKTEDPVVTTAKGKLRGKTGRNFNNELFYSFQGIPYAKPPFGPLRFKSPQPVEPWTGIRDATHEGDDCLSRHTVLRTIIGSENCLTLNVYTRDLPINKINKALKPVMVWIHGGGFTSGSGSTEVYGPEFLMTKDIVLVTINYRTGILGFLNFQDPELNIPGNAGLKDMVMALKWIQENISEFSGDPKNVTIFGESAGAAACHYMILSPKAKGLFHKAILQSGCALNIWAHGRNYAQELSEVLGLDTSDERTLLKILQELPPDELYKSVEKVYDPFIANRVRPHGPVIEKPSDDAFLTEDPLEIVKSGRYNHVPILIGFTSKEGILGEIIQKPKPFKPITDFELSVPHFLNLPPGSDTSKELAQEIKKFYYGDEEPTTENKESYYLLETDNFFLRELLRTIHYHKETSKEPIFLYRISAESGLNMLKNIYNIKNPGVCHADDLGYLFKNLLTPHIEPGSAEDIAIKRFVEFWTNFAKRGDPNPEEETPFVSVQWKQVTEESLNYIDIGEELSAGVDPESERMEFWRKILNVQNVC